MAVTRAVQLRLCGREIGLAFSSIFYYSVRTEDPCEQYVSMRPIQLRYLRWRNTPRWAIHDQRRCYSSPSHDPLRILFCGADEFSIYSLRALHDLHLRQPSKVASIDVVCKTDKRVGRGLKKTQEGNIV